MLGTSLGRWRLRTTAVLAGSVISGAAFAAPEISGVWNRYPPYADTFSKHPCPPELQVVTPPLRQPYLQQWKDLQEQRAEGEKNGKPLPTRSSLCLPEGMPEVMGAHYALQILQNPDIKQITVLAEFMAQTRRIYLAEKAPPQDEVGPSFYGYSVGKWHGNVLDVTTEGVRPDVRYADIPHSEEMKISERIYLAAPDRLNDDITIVDPQYLTKPYKFRFMYKKEPLSYKIGEFECTNQHTYVKKDGTLGESEDVVH